ncbi:hypothetical protein D3C78_1702520 [compost metagenome]
MVGPNLLAGHGGKTNVFRNCTLVPRLTHAKAAHVADFHVHHHLRRRHHHIAHVVKRVNSGVSQPVIQPHGVGAGREGLGEGIGAFGAGIDGFFQARSIGDTGLP